MFWIGTNATLGDGIDGRFSKCRTYDSILTVVRLSGVVCEVVWYWYGIPLLINLGSLFDYLESAIPVNPEHWHGPLFHRPSMRVIASRKLTCATSSAVYRSLLSLRASKKYSSDENKNFLA